MDLIKQYVNKRKGSYFLSVILAIIGVVAGLFSYVYMAKIIVNILEGISDISIYKSLCLMILLLFVIKEIAAGISTSISHTATFNSLGEIRNDISKKLFKMPLGDVLSRSSGELKNIIIEQVDSMETSLAHLVPEFTANLVGPVLLFIYMFTLDWRLTLLSLIPFVVGMATMMSVMNAHYKEMFGKSVAIGQHMNNSIVEYINGIEVIKTFNQSESSYKKYADAVYNNASFYYNWMGESMNRVAIGRLLSPMGIITIIPFGILFYINGSIDLGNLITLIVLSFATVSSILKIMNYMDDMSRISTITSEIGKILDSRELENEEKGISEKDYSIKLENIEFSYEEDKKVIDDISFDINPNSVSALVGPSGSGKSTLAKLIAGFWNVDKGNIKIGGVDTRHMSLEKLSSLISFVSQDNFLFDMSIKENIRIGKKDASDEEIIEVCKKSACHDFIMNLSDGYDTKVGEGGGHLSGGERQRISIARAMLKDAPIIILDEATSYIDPENEALIQNALANLVAGKTLLIIAHRLKTVTDADKIFVINNGKLDAEGSHEELLKSSSLYKEMYESSLRGEENA
ncbi:ABC transporter ATP-binding protein/permease [Peptoniphilus sp. MSJ-1]|uniref:ABC transporter ATP-binding protein/permease n=1 Tax=Peptoniphilus ovalis TaxID=2841503 RepID=A0ABS6FL95_9FIRM|nr:ABC transporter ATP-binding protein [Peptoniphilus ovalis]MBU5670021.1 ABC transporter ATP-binding protein/permease [Peptoniphilus ovalis]